MKILFLIITVGIMLLAGFIFIQKDTSLKEKSISTIQQLKLFADTTTSQILKTKDLPKLFLKSTVITPLGMNNLPYGKFTVEEIIQKLSKKQLNNGKYPHLIGWTKNDNEYTFSFFIKNQEMKLHFIHYLGSDYENGKYSLMYTVIDNEEFPGYLFISNFIKN